MSMRRAIYPTTRSVIVALVTTFGVLAAYAALKWLELPAGDLIDWAVGIAGFWWLIGIVTIPWNLYFGAKRVSEDLRESERRGIGLLPRDVAYVEQISRRALALAVALHGLSAIGFAGLAWFGLTPVGWFGATAALALTLFRPAVQLYRHVVSMLTDIGHRARYPRDDIETLRDRVVDLECTLSGLEDSLDLRNESSWAHQLQTNAEQLERRVQELRVDHTAQVQANAEEHQRLSREAKRAAEQVAEDSEFLGNVREIIRFVKSA